MKREMRSCYVENSKKNMEITIAEVVNKFSGMDMTSLFNKCGYKGDGHFDASVGLSQDLTILGFNN